MQVLLTYHNDEITINTKTHSYKDENFLNYSETSK